MTCGRYAWGHMKEDLDFRPILTDRLILRRSTSEDAATISGYRSIPDVLRHQGWDRTDPDSIREEIQEAAGRAPGGRGGWVQFSLEERESGVLVGDVGLSLADRDPGVIKAGYTVAPEFQGQGYATEAVRALVAYAFERLDAEVVRAYASAENSPSIRVAENVGMRPVERFEELDGDHVWRGVRYELRRKDSAG